MTKPLWEWAIIKAIVHVTFLVLTLPLAIAGAYYYILQLRISKAIDFLGAWASEPQEMIP